MRILIVTSLFPPRNVIGAHRPYSWARTWTDLGHEVHVITTRRSVWDGTQDLALDMHGFSVHEVAFMGARGNYAKPGTAQDTARRAELRESVKAATRRVRLALGIFGDPANLACRPMARAARKLASRESYDFMISTSPPEVAHFAARAVSRATNTPWIADYRDLWLGEMRVHQPRITTALSEIVHRRILRDATAIVTVSQGLANAMRQRTAREAIVSYNGFYDAPPSSREASADGKIHVVHTGRLFEKKRDPSLFLDALADFRRSTPGGAARIQVDLYGHQERWLERFVIDRRLDDCVRFHGFVSHAKSSEAQRAADVLLFVDWMDEKAEGVLTGKLFEYLGSGRPILCVTNRKRTEASELIRSCEAGSILTTRSEIIALLKDLAASGRPTNIAIGNAAKYSRRNQATKLLDQISGILAARAAGKPRVNS